MFFALEIEAAFVFKELSRMVTGQLASPRFHSPTSFCFPGGQVNGTWNWTGCVLGPGTAFEKHLRLYLAELDFKPDWVILAGFSGGLGIKGQIGTTFEIKEVRQTSPEQGALSNSLTQGVATPLGCAPLADSLHGVGILCSPNDKTTAFRDSSCDLVDMESLFFLREMKSLGLPCSIFRSISDGPQENLPVQAMNWMNEMGGLSMGRLAWDLITHPWLIRDLIRMAGGSSRAGKSLGKVVVQALRVLSES